MNNYKKLSQRLLLTLFAILSFSSQAREMQPLFEHGAFRETYELVQKLEPEGYRAQMLATYYTFVGRQDLVYDIEEMLPLPDKCLEDGDPSLSFAEPWAETAFNDYKVVMINENHFQLASRAWLLGMLESFKDQGFTHIGFEAFRPGDKHPDEGFYTHEPVFAALVERAHDLDFEVFGYESTKEVPEGASALEVREQTQAQNIADTIDDADSDSRFLIFAGWGHIAKYPVGDDGQLWMAARFMQLTDIEPYAIDLVSCVYDASQVVRPESGKVMLDSEGTPILKGRFGPLVDAQLHLPTISGETKSTGFYRQALGEAVPIPESLRHTGGTRLVRAFKASRSDSIVPYDQVLLFAGENHPLYLGSGHTYELISVDEKGEIHGRETINMPAR